MRAPLDILRAALGEASVRDDAETLASHGRDWTRYFEPKPCAVAFPRSTAEVEAIVRWAATHRVGLVPSGGRTGLSGGAVAAGGELVVSFDRMNRILALDPVDRLVSCEAGVVTEVLQQHVADHGLFFPVDFASRGSSQLGGNVATNAGGIKVLRWGLMRDWVAGLTVVAGTGDVLELNRGLVKNATGYDLRHLFIGSEGTLGLITEVTLALTRPPRELGVLVLAVAQLDDVMSVFHAFRDAVELTAFEMFSDAALEIVLARGHVPAPFAGRAPYYVLVELEQTTPEAVEAALAVFEEASARGWVVDGVMGQSDKQKKDLWRLREDISESLAPFTPYKNDIAVRISRVPDFVRELDAVLTREYPDFRVIWFGHLGDGNLHINVLKPEDMDKAAFFTACQRVDTFVFRAVEKFGGSISAEHGVGLIKKPFLGYTRSDAEIALMRGLKRVFDPEGIMNPGKML